MSSPIVDSVCDDVCGVGVNEAVVSMTIPSYRLSVFASLNFLHPTNKSYFCK